MVIGITYDLRDDYLKMGFSREDAAEFDIEETIAAIDNTLQELGYQTSRIGHLHHLLDRLLKKDRWDMVFNICEGYYGIGREAQVPAVLDAFRIPYVFSNPLVLALTLDKGMTKRVIRDAGIPTAPFAVISDPVDIESVDLPFPVFAKPVAEGTGKGISGKSIIYNHNRLDEQCRYLLERFGQPVLVEEYLTGREFTVGITGTGRNAAVTGVMEVLLTDKAEQGVYSYDNKDNWQENCLYRLESGKDGEMCTKVALDAWKVLGCEDGGRIDLRMNSGGIPNFIEVNPLAGLNPHHSDLPILSALNGISYNELIGRIMDSAIQKITRK